MPQAGFAQAVAPLLASGSVEVVEWTLDIGLGRQLPPWLDDVLRAFSDADRLLGHATGGSLFSARWTARQADWMQGMGAAMGRHTYRHLSEHMGVMTTPEWAWGPPLPVPFSGSAVTLGVQRLRSLAAATGASVGLENLALAWSREDVLARGPLMGALLEETGGFLHLDLHNLWCQATNFALDPLVLMARLPLARARVLHVSGGSWSGEIRRDTHDARVPEAVLGLIPVAMARCPNLEAVVLERIGSAFETPAQQEAFRVDFHRVAAAVADAAASRRVAPVAPALPALAPVSDTMDALAALQRATLAGLAAGTPPAALRDGLLGDPALAPYHPWIASFRLDMLPVATELVARWGRPANAHGRA